MFLHMAHHLSILFFIISAAFAASSLPLVARRKMMSADEDFIQLSCKSTLYPDLCYQTLSPYNATIHESSLAMALVALNVSLDSTMAASQMALKIFKANKLTKHEAGVVADCVETVGDAVEELQKSTAAMKDLEGPEFQFKVNSIQTWVSAALTDENTCMNGYEDPKKLSLTTTKSEEVKMMIRSEIVNVAQLTSIALALVNKLPSA